MHTCSLYSLFLSLALCVPNGANTSRGTGRRESKPFSDGLLPAGRRHIMVSEVSAFQQLGWGRAAVTLYLFICFLLSLVCCWCP